MNPAVSILVTVYQRTEFLAQAVRSALAQTWPGTCEIIVTDDSASGAIRAICAEFPADRVRYRTNAGNLGVVANLRAAAAEARGELVAILNDDDYWDPRFLERLAPPLLADAGRVLAFCDHWIVNGDGSVDAGHTERSSVGYGRSALPEGDVADFAGLALNKGVPLAMAAVFRRDAVDWGRVAGEVSGAYDFWLACLLAATGGRAYYVPERLTSYRVHGGMETARRAPDKNEHLVYIYRELLAMPCFAGRRRFLRARLSEALRLVGKDRLFFGQAGEARRRFRESARLGGGWKSVAWWGMSWRKG